MESSGLLTFIREHFAHAAPILAVGALSLVIIFERCYTLFYRYPMPDVEGYFEKITALVMQAKIPEAAALCDKYESKPIANVVKSALARAHLPEGLIRDGIQLTMQNSSKRILKRTSYLATTANVATLLGLFGTIAGLIQSFEAVAHADAQQKSALLSAGISTAMNATMLGLGVAIPCMIAYSLLMSRTNTLIADLENAGVRTADILKQRFYASEFVQSPLSHPQPEKTEKAA